MFNSGTKMFWKNTGKPAYEKVGNDACDWWVSLDSFFVVKTQQLDEKTGEMLWVHETHPESEKPLYKADGSLNRFGFKWPDEQVYDYYKDIMTFEN